MSAVQIYGKKDFRQKTILGILTPFKTLHFLPKQRKKEEFYAV
jgi:hypothetical protein